MPIILTVVQGPHTGRIFTIDRHDTFVVGRSRDAHLSLPNDPYFSRHHLLVEVNPPLCRVTDLNSRNGTEVNGAKVATAELNHGDEVACGQTALRVTITATAEGELATLDLPPSGATIAASPLKFPPKVQSLLDRVELTPPTTPGTPRTWPSGLAGGLVVPGYRDLTEIGRGGMGVVYRALRESDGAEVAVKTITPSASPDPTEVSRFLRETQVLYALTHPHIVRFHASGQIGGSLYFVMDFVDGTDASRLVGQQGPLPLSEAVPLIGQVCEALGFAHAKGFVHRDVKPGNLLLARTEGRWSLKLADFGLAKAYQGTRMSGLTVSGTSAGTPAFIPPEQVTDFKTARPAADQYAAGATGYYLLSGMYPFGTGSTRTVLKRVLAGEVDRLEKHRSDLPRAAHGCGSPGDGGEPGGPLPQRAYVCR